MSITTNNNFSCISKLWEKLDQRTPFQSIEWNSLFWKFLKGYKELVIVSNENCILPLHVRTIDDIRITEFVGTRGSDYLDYIGNSDNLFSLLDELLSTNIWDIIRFEDVPESSELIKYKSKYPFRINENVNCYSIKIPPSYHKRTVRDLQYYQRKMNLYFKEQINYVFKDDISSIDNYLSLHVSRQSSKGDNYHLPDNSIEFLKSFFSLMDKQGKLYLSGLYIENRLVSGIISVSWNLKLFGFYMGFDSKYQKWHVGWVLLSYILATLDELSFEEFDLSRGNDEYKIKLGGKKKINYLFEIFRNEEFISKYEEIYKAFTNIKYYPSDF